MKTILYNPIFINPQAYYVFPRLTRYLQPDNESTAEPANYIGTIEVKVIAYGDTTLKRTYTNTDSIDLSEFKNTWIRISLFTKVGSCVLGEWKIGNMESDLPYIDPEVLASLKAVVIVGNKTNNDSDRAIVKNLVDPDNPFVISNAAYDKMSSYGGYEFAKFDNTLDWYNTEGNDSVEVVSRNGHSITLKRLTGPNFWYFQNSTFRGLISNVIPFKVNSNKNITVIWDVHGLSISEGKDKSVRIQELVLNPNEDNYTNLKTLNEEELAQIDISTNSLYYLLWFDLSTLAVDEEVTIEMLPLFEGAFVTDGIDDLITSTKTVQEMLGGSNEITVVSMIHQVKDSSNNVSFTNYIRGSANGYFRNIVNNYDKTGIYGYTSSDLMGLSVVNNILGDKNDYTSNGDNRDSIINGNFSVQGYSYNDGNNTGDFSSVAWYWTIIANKVLTTDQINQVIAYFNLDRTLKSDIYCNIAKQGITNENHAEFTFNGVSIGYSRSITVDTAFNIGHIYNYDSPQEVNITIDEYIRYEDIVQPYPVLLRFNDENGNEVSWGGKFRVGSTITRIGSVADSNLLPNIYNIFGLLLNDNQVTSSKVIVEKTMVFKAKSAYIFDNNEPKCILSPRLLRIPNSSYKILGHIPDISGHGNHGKINNSAYAGMSGVNGYPVVFGANKTWANESNGYVTSITSNTIHITNVLNAGLALLYSYVKYNGNLQNIKEIPPFKIEIKGLEGRSKFIYKYLATSDATKETNLYLGNGTHELPKSFLPTEALINNAVVGFSISPIEEGVTNFLSDITIKVLPKYEGAYCLDGVDDFVTIPTTVGGKQVLMKVNWDSSNSALLYDQRGYNNEFAIYNGSADSDGNPIPAYQGRNNGQTYIDGILNSNIKASELRAITHNITITNELSAGVNKFSPVIGSNRVHNAYFTNMALYDFMLFDNISTDDKIKELNEYVGIEGNTEWRKTK